MSKDLFLEPPEGTKLFSSVLSDDGSEIVETFGVNRIRRGELCYREHGVGLSIVFNPGLIRVAVLKQELSAAELNWIGEKVLDLFACHVQFKMLLKILTDTVRFELDLRSLAAQSVSYETSRIANLDTVEIISGLGAYIRQMAENRDVLEGELRVIAKELYQNGVVHMVSKTDHCGFPIDRMAQE